MFVTIRTFCVFLLACVLFVINIPPAFSKNERKNNFSFAYYEQGVKLHMKGDLKNAAAYFTNALTLVPSDLPTLIELGEVQIELGQYDLALSTLKQAVSFTSDDPLIQVLLGIAFKENKQCNEALEHFKQAIKLDPDNVLLKTNFGLTCFQVNDFKCVIENLGKVVIAYPYQLKARVALGTAYHSLKDYALAKEQYEFVLKYEPLNLSLWYNLAKTQIALSKFEEAKKSINNAIELDESVVELYLDRAFINYKLKNTDEAEKDYLKALKLDPANPVIPVEFGNYLWMTGKYTGAAEQFEKAIELNPADGSLLTVRAYLLQLAKKEKEAINAWQTVIEKEPENSIAYFNLARLYQEKKEYEKSIENYRKVLALAKSSKEEDLEAKSALAYCLQETNKLSEAKSLYLEILKEKPADSNILYNIGVLFGAEKNHKEAITYFERAIQFNFPIPGKAYQALTEAYTALNDTDNLKLTFKNWLDLDKDNVNARISYAKFLAMNGASQDAIDQYRLAVALDNTNKSKFKLAQFLIEQKDYYGALNQLQEYMKTEGEDVNALILLADTYKNLNINEQAVNTYRKIIAVQIDNYLAYYNLGLLYERDKKYEEAQNSLLKSIEINDKYAPAYYALGLAYMLNNSSGDKNDKKAKELFEKYLQLEPNGEYKNIVDAKLKELLNKPAITQPPA